jgi:uncharacterized FlaG/YvyC family protein
MEVHNVDVPGVALAAPPADGAPSPAHAAAPPDQSKAAAGREQRLLSTTIGQLFGAPAEHKNAVEVSYRPGGLNEIVTVFTDPSSGKEIAQLPAHILIEMAAFFDQHSGVTLDRNA